MSDDKSKASDKASEIAKNIWLAGLGAYGKAFDEAHDRLDKAAKEPPRLFKELVEKVASWKTRSRTPSPAFARHAPVLWRSASAG